MYNKTKDIDFLNLIYNSATINNQWWYDNRDEDKDGLCEWEGTTSGWDTSPRWDNGTVEAIDLNCWLAFD